MSRFLHTRVKIVLKQNCKGIFLFSQLECKLFLILFSDGVREEHQISDCIA